MSASVRAGVLAVIALNLLAHFLPFERVALSGDDMSYLATPPGERAGLLWSQTVSSPKRPLEASVSLLHWIAGENKGMWVLLLFLASSLLAACVYLLMRRLTGDAVSGFVCAAFYVLLPNKERLYHHLGYAHIHAVVAFTVASFIFFLSYLRSSKPSRLWASVACYGVTLFWYELGFFLPVALAAAALPHGKQKLKACLWFLLPVAVDILWRSRLLTGESFYLAPLFKETFWDNLADSRKLYFGKHMRDWVRCGLAQFPAIERPWFWVLLAADAAALGGFWRWFRRNPFPAVPPEVLPVAVAMGVLFLVPPAMGYEVLGRHTPLSSIGFSILAVAVLRKGLPRPLLAPVLVLLLGAGLVVCQGLAWSQVVSCRMNHAILETLQQHKASMAAAGQRVVIDQESFAREIPSTWKKDSQSHMDSYWGVDGLLGENFRGPAHWAAGWKIPVEIIRSPLEWKGDTLILRTYNPNMRRYEQQGFPRERVVLIDFAAVYPYGFRNGKKDPDSGRRALTAPAP